MFFNNNVYLKDKTLTINAFCHAELIERNASSSYKYYHAEDKSFSYIDDFYKKVGIELDNAIEVTLRNVDIETAFCLERLKNLKSIKIENFSNNPSVLYNGGTHAGLEISSLSFYGIPLETVEELILPEPNQKTKYPVTIKPDILTILPNLKRLALANNNGNIIIEAKTLHDIWGLFGEYYTEQTKLNAALKSQSQPSGTGLQ